MPREEIQEALEGLTLEIYGLRWELAFNPYCYAHDEIQGPLPGHRLVLGQHLNFPVLIIDRAWERLKSEVEVNFSCW